jgi:hypothetical protein
MEFLFFIFPILMIFGTHKTIVAPFLNGTMEIDRNAHPTLFRAQRILRARNVKAREKELKAIQSKLAEETKQGLRALETKFAQDLKETREKHHEEVIRWGNDFRAITAEEDHARALEEERKLAAHNKERQRLYEENRQKEIAAENKRVWEKNREDEARYNAQAKAWASNPANSAGTRLIDPNMSMNVRHEPTTRGRLWGILVAGLQVTVDGWIYGESLLYRPTGAYNNIWFRLEQTSEDTEPLYIWSGGLTNASTQGIRSLNPQGQNGIITAAKITTGSLVIDNQGLWKTMPVPMDSLREKRDRISKLSDSELDGVLRNVQAHWHVISEKEPTADVVDQITELVDLNDAISAEKELRKDQKADFNRKLVQAGGFTAPTSTAYELIPNQGNGHHASALYAKIDPPPPIKW